MTEEVKKLIESVQIYLIEIPKGDRVYGTKSVILKSDFDRVVNELAKTNEEAISNAWDEGYESGYNCACDGSTVSF